MGNTSETARDIAALVDITGFDKLSVDIDQVFVTNLFREDIGKKMVVNVIKIRLDITLNHSGNTGSSANLT